MPIKKKSQQAVVSRTKGWQQLDAGNTVFVADRSGRAV
jgi:hypothetical protein